MIFTSEGLLSFHAAVHDSLDLLLDQAASLPNELLDRQVAGFGADTIRKQIFHIIANEAIWLRGLKGQPLERLSIDDYPTVGALRLAKRQTAADTRTYFADLTRPELNAVIEALPSYWVGPPRSPAFILLHVLTHACHHKGQVVAMFRLLGYPAPDTDLQRSEG